MEDNAIQVNPYTFSVNPHKEHLVAYHLDGYPDRLDPVTLNYQLPKY